jgi:hypothetical protein
MGIRTASPTKGEIEAGADVVSHAMQGPRMPWPSWGRLNEVVRMIARVGGFLARKSDGEPGTKTIWEGLRDVRASAHTIKTLREMGLLSSCV